MKTLETIKKNSDYNLVTEYNSAAFKWMLPNKIQEQLNKNTVLFQQLSELALTELFMLTVSETSVVQRASWKSIDAFLKLPAGKAYKLLYEQYKSLFIVSNCQAIMRHEYPSLIFDALSLLHDSKLLDQQSFNTIIAHTQLQFLKETMAIMHSSKILNAQNYNIAKAHPILDFLHSSLFLFRKEELTTLHFMILAKDNNPEYSAYIIRLLEKKNLFTYEHFIGVRTNGPKFNPTLQHKKLLHEEAIVDMLHVLKKADLDTTKQIHQLSTHLNTQINSSAELLDFAEAMKIFDTSLTDILFDALLLAINPLYVARLSQLLVDRNILTLPNIELMGSCLAQWPISSSTKQHFRAKDVESILADIIKILQNNAMLEESITAIGTHFVVFNQEQITNKLAQLYQAIQMLHTAQLASSPLYLPNLLTHPDPISLATILCLFHKKKILNGMDVTIIVQHEKPKELASAYVHLYEEKKIDLNTIYTIWICNQPSPFYAARIILLTIEENLLELGVLKSMVRSLKQWEVEPISAPKEPLHTEIELITTFTLLKRNSLLGVIYDASFDEVISVRGRQQTFIQLQELNRAIRLLRDNAPLNQATFLMAAYTPSPTYSAQLIILMEEENILRTLYFDQIHTLLSLPSIKQDAALQLEKELIKFYQQLVNHQYLLQPLYEALTNQFANNSESMMQDKLVQLNKALQALHQAKLPIQTHYMPDLIAHHTPWIQAQIIMLLQKETLLVSERYEVCKKHPKSAELLSTLKRLSDVHQLNATYADYVAYHPYPSYAAALILMLSEANLTPSTYFAWMDQCLAQWNIECPLLEVADPKILLIEQELTKTLWLIDQMTNIEEQQAILLLLQGQKNINLNTLQHINKAFYFFTTMNLLTYNNAEYVVSHSSPAYAACLITILQQHDLCTLDCVNAIERCIYEWPLNRNADFFSASSQFDIEIELSIERELVRLFYYIPPGTELYAGFAPDLNSAFKNKSTGSIIKGLRQLYQAISSLHRNEILHLGNLKQLFSPSSMFLYPQEGHEIWQRVALYPLSQSQFNTLIHLGNEERFSLLERQNNITAFVTSLHTPEPPTLYTPNFFSSSPTSESERGNGYASSNKTSSSQASFIADEQTQLLSYAEPIVNEQEKQRLEDEGFLAFLARSEQTNTLSAGEEECSSYSAW